MKKYHLIQTKKEDVTEDDLKWANDVIVEYEKKFHKTNQKEAIMNSNNPLFLPEGSVRALLAIMLIGGTLYATIAGVAAGTEVLYTLTGGVMAHYFNARGKIGNNRDGS